MKTANWINKGEVLLLYLKNFMGYYYEYLTRLEHIL